MCEEKIEVNKKRLRQNDNMMALIEVFVAILIPTVMFAPVIAVIFGIIPFLSGGYWVASFFVVMCGWVVLVLRNEYYFSFSLMIIALVSIFSLLVVKCFL